MSQITLLKTIVRASGIYPTPQHRSRAIANLEAKISRRDRKIKACTQLTIFVDHGYTPKQTTTRTNELGCGNGLG